jgi:signal transduction histidine kinase
VNVPTLPRPLIAGASLAMTAIVFAIDLRSPIEINVPLLYILPIVLSLWQSRRATFLVATVVTLLTAIRVIWFSSSYWSVDATTNRALALLAIWVTAIGVWERKRAETRLQQQAELARLGEIAMVVAHEVRNALAGIRAVVDVVCARLSSADRDQAIKEEMSRRVNSLEQLTTNLLTLWRPMQPVMTPSAVMPIVQRAIDLLKRDPQFAVAVRTEGEDVWLPIDEQLVQLALSNLILNAAQAMNGAGMITIGVDQAGGTCRIRIRDSGPGIPPEVKQKMFDAFFTTKTRGTGLGLPIAKRAVERHGGALTIESTLGRGTTATVALPLTQIEVT